MPLIASQPTPSRTEFSGDITCFRSRASGQVWLTYPDEPAGVDIATIDSAETIIQARVGLAITWIDQLDKSNLTLGSLLEHLEGCYGSPLSKFDSEVDVEDGTLRSKGDTDLWPCAEAPLTSEITLFSYLYGFVGATDGKDSFVVRMD